MLDHRTWYTARNTGSWSGVSRFTLHHVVQVGDASSDGTVLFNDLSLINEDVPSFGVPDDDRKDIDGDGNVLFNDLSLANANVPSFAVDKPSGR